MKIRKDLIVVALATFCLTATLFMVVLTRSADDPNWDPWVDIKEDGTVDIYDAITLANAYGTSGDTTKNVTVTNWRTNRLLLAVNTTVISDDWYFSNPISLEGFSKVSICLHCGTNNNFYQLRCKDSRDTYTFIVENIDNIPTTLVKTYDVPNEYIMISYWNKAMTNLAFHLDVYGIA